MSTQLRDLADLRSADEYLFGGKSASLGELIRAEVNVPGGFAVSAAAFTAFLQTDGLVEQVERQLAGLEPSDVDALALASDAIAAALRAAVLPNRLREQVERAYRRLGEQAAQPEPAVAVRSSARGEDSADATFAGQQETFLWVSGVEPICDAIRECWVSLYSPPAISYRARMAADDAPAMGVTVQLMVDAAVSGVMFTCSPISGDPSVVAVNSSWGLGLGVVSGEVTPDEFVLSKITSEVLRQTISDKAIEYLHDPSGRGALRAQTPAERRLSASLEEHQLVELVAVGKRIDRHFGSRQDIEWAVGRGGTFPANLFILQSRPVTATGTAGSDAVEELKGAGAMSLLLGTFGVKRQDH